MLLQVQVINGEKVLVPLSGGTGNPLGTILAIYSNQVPAGYLPCNGVAFDENQFPALYQLLGDNHTPDLRECTLKMIGENPNGEGHVKSGGLAIGEFIDDRMQDHQHTISRNGINDGGSAPYGTVDYDTYPTYPKNWSGGTSGRRGVTTEVKAVGVNYVIKATSGLDETQQDYVLQSLNEQSSYSTEEVATGKKWIDGKMIYRRTYYSATNWANNTVIGTISNLGSVVTVKDLTTLTTNDVYQNYGNDGSNYAMTVVNTSNGNVKVMRGGAFVNNLPSSVTVEYTKTT